MAQAAAVRKHLEALPHDERPTLVISSPYQRASWTARCAVQDIDVDLVFDERLRERDLGQFDGLTGAGIRHLFADESERHRKVGKFYYQPPGGESWADVVLQVRSLLGDLRQGFDGQRVWMFTHQAVIMAFRYVIEGTSEAELLEIDRDSPIPNCSSTAFDFDEHGARLRDFALTAALAGECAHVTAKPSTSHAKAVRN